MKTKIVPRAALFTTYSTVKIFGEGKDEKGQG